MVRKLPLIWFRLFNPASMLLCVLTGLQTHIVNAATLERPDDETRTLLHQTIDKADSFKDRFDAEVWLVDMDARLARYVKNPQERMHILQLVHTESHRFQLQPELVLSVMHVESLFDRYAVSTVGAQGLMQVMPFWKNEIGTTSDNLTDIATNIRYGCAILKTYLTREKGNMMRALARYNGSLGKTWYPERVFNAWERYWFVRY
ncbi:lytic transglycosylase domain-containing protein [Ketobacter nezhaii]|uniref:lytic transglycosylase domain-containing protein n=1 Tax=Ketobacter sp. MCCC 1A13808 TaxID=2602738 RepID=UPI001E52F115|nr:lytic transglycosylase domain-containing protein [Ketobacter sp. MCCC 1A13808]